MDFLYVLYPLDVISTLESIRVDVVGSKLAVMSSVASLLAAILCAFSLIKISHDYIEGQGITLGVILRPIIITFLVCQFNLFVASPISGLCNMFTRSITASMSDQKAQFVDLMGKMVRARASSPSSEIAENTYELEAEQEQATEQPQTQLDKLLIGLKKWGGNIVSAIFRTNLSASEIATVFVVDILSAFGVVLISAFSFGLKIYAYVILILLTLLGPFAFALAILPPFSNAIASWIGRFINVSLWIPICQIICWLFYYILDALGNVMITTHDMGISWTLVTISVVFLLCIMGVPKIANFVIESAGAGGIHDNINSALKSAGMFAVGKAFGKKA